MTHIDCAVVGAGPTGLMAVRQLLRQGIPPEEIRVIDPHQNPLQVWDYNNTQIGRTPDGFPTSEALLPKPDPVIAPPYPLTQLSVEKLLRSLRRTVGELKEHCSTAFIRDSLVGLERCQGKITLNMLSGHSFQADHVILALGDNDIPRWPGWAKQLKDNHCDAPVYHLFDMGFVRERDIKPSTHTVIVGSGRPAVELALLLSEGENNQVTVITRNKIRKRWSELSVDRDWVPEQGRLFNEFHQTADRQKKCELLEMPPRIGINPNHYELFKDAVEEGKIRFLEEVTVVNADYAENQVTLNLEHKKNRLPLGADQVVLTNFMPNQKKQDLIDRIAENLNAPINQQTQLPELNRSFEWVPGVFVTGALSSWQAGALPVLTQGLMASDVIAKKIADEKAKV